jgi:pimeloyl-ACP methyl ester carboxylesterase
MKIGLFVMGKGGFWMKFYAFGDENAPVLFLLPGTCCHWRRNFGGGIPLLEPDFHVICASYDGFDETANTTFPDMLTETARIEVYLRENFAGHISAAYGCSLGGSFVGLLVQRQKIHIDHAILGSSDMDQSAPTPAKLKGQLVSPILHKMFQTGKLPGWMQKRLDKKNPEERAYMEPMLSMFGVGSRDIAFVKKESIYCILCGLFGRVYQYGYFNSKRQNHITEMDVDTEFSYYEAHDQRLGKAWNKCFL